jgi:two-component system response regulator NreC
MTTKILIADDHGVLRAGLRALLNAEPDFEVVGEAGSGREVVDLAPRLRPDVVLMDISMPDVDGIVATRALAVELPQVRVLLLTVHEDEALLREGIRAGAAGYIVKRAVESELIDAIRAVASGDLYVHPAMTRALLRDTSPRAPRASRISDLTPRETEVLSLIAQGYTNRQIAERLQLSTRTVESHRANLMAKLNLRSRAELVRYAADRGLLGI